MTRLAKRRLLLVATLVAVTLSGARFGVSLASFSTSATARGQIAAGYWVPVPYRFFLHDDGNGQAEADADAMTASAPTYESAPPGSVPYYSVNCDQNQTHRAQGRVIGGAAGVVTSPCSSVSWQTDALAGRTITGSVVVTFWEGLASWNSASPPFDGAGGVSATTTVALVDLTASTVVASEAYSWTQTGNAWLPRSINLSSVNWTVPAAHLAGIRISAVVAGGIGRVHIAYDTTAYAAAVSLKAF